MPFGTVKSVIKAAKAGFASDSVVEVRHDSYQPTTAATGAEVGRKLQVHVCAGYHDHSAPTSCGVREKPLSRRAGVAGWRARLRSILPALAAILRKTSHAQYGCAVVHVCSGVE